MYYLRGEVLKVLQTMALCVLIVFDVSHKCGVVIGCVFLHAVWAAAYRGHVSCF